MGNMMNGFTQMSQNLQGQQPVQGAPGAGMSAGAVAGASAGNTAANSWTCECGATNTGKFCSNCGKPAPAAEWTCECGATNKGNFCSNCGKPRA